MSLIPPDDFKEVWLFDFEFSAPPGERPSVNCLVAWEIKAGRKLRIWQDQLLNMKEPPYSTGKEALFIAYYASAEMICHLVLGWSLPENLLDLYVEFRNRTNGLSLCCSNGLSGALTYFGLNGIDVIEKETMRELSIRGGPWTHEEREALLAYCETDVRALSNLLPEMLPTIDLPRALLRGRYMKAAAQIEHNGTPMDAAALQKLRPNWERIKETLVAEMDTAYGVYDGTIFKMDRFAEWLVKNDIPWPRLQSGKLSLDDDTFKEMSRIYPTVSPLRELRTALSKMKLSELAVGKDGRNRCLLSAFGAKTGRNQPSNAQFIFGPSVWLRGLIRPEEGKALAYIDWSQQEFGIAAVLSGDPLMIEAYESGSPYLTFARQAGAVPLNATKASHPQERAQFKECALAVQYGMGAEALGIRIGRSTSHARDLLRLHRETYKTFWKWVEDVVDYAMLNGRLYTVFGWSIHIGANVNTRSLLNFPMQSNASEMLRLACCFTIERGIKVCAPIHDAILVEAPLDKIDKAVRKTQQAMSDASALVLDDFRLRSDAKIIRHPDRYMDERGRKMWNTVWDIINRLDGTNLCTGEHPTCA